MNLFQKVQAFLKYVFAAALAAVTPTALAGLGLAPEYAAIVMAGIGAALLHLRKPADVTRVLPARADAEAYDDGYAAGYEDAKRDYGPLPDDAEDDAPDTMPTGGVR